MPKGTKHYIQLFIEFSRRCVTSAADIMQFLVLLSDKSYEIQGNHAFMLLK